MPSFAFTARDCSGRLVRGIEYVSSEGELDQVLAERALTLIKASSDRHLSRRRASGRELIEICYYLAIVVEAGIPLLQGLRDLQSDENLRLAQELGEIASRIEAGSRLSEAFAVFPHLFPGLVVSLISAGEETGDLDAVLRDLVRYLEWREELRRKVLSATTYPAIVLVAMFGLCILLTTVVLPNFLGIFEELAVDLPAGTRALIAGQNFLEAHGVLLLVVLTATIASLVALTRFEWGKVRWHRLLLKTPVVGKVLLMLEMSRFAHNLGLLYRSGIPIVRCLELIREIVQNRVLRTSVGEALDLVRRGESLTQAFESKKLVPTLVVRMLALGEKSGGLDESLSSVSRYYDRELPLIIDRSLALFNGAVIAGLGALLAVIGLSIFVPLYQMMGNLSAG